ncbi:MAG: glyoxalase [Lachnospiraceae bacterium]|nr:glyoxalase [Lachnospiraceae bacterium]
MELQGYEEECAKVFLEQQDRLFAEPVASNYDEALEFLEDSFACVFDSADEIRQYWEENGTDASGMSDEEILESLEVFELPCGKYMVVEA